MAYTNNVPQGNQQIAATQPLIQENFGFLPMAIGQEHNFNASGTGTDTYHLKASMPNLVGGDPIALPAGTNGMYYVLGGLPKFYNTSGAVSIATGAVASFVPFNGSFTILNNTTQNIPGITGNVGGFISGYRSDQIDTTNVTSVFFQNSTLSPDPTNTIVPLASNGGGLSIIYLWNGTNLAIRNQSGSTRTVKFFGWYYPTV